MNEQDLQISGVGSHDTAMDKAVQYAEIHGNQEAISKFNITAESFYKYLSRGIVKERELEVCLNELIDLKRHSITFHFVRVYLIWFALLLSNCDVTQ